MASGNISGAALQSISNKYNEMDEEIRKLKITLDNLDKSKISRILTFDYFKTLCKQQSKVLAHSLLPQRRAFVEKCIEAVILDPTKKEVHIKLDINPFFNQKNDSKEAKKLEKQLKKEQKRREKEARKEQKRREKEARKEQKRREKEAKEKKNS